MSLVWKKLHRIEKRNIYKGQSLLQITDSVIFKRQAKGQDSIKKTRTMFLDKNANHHYCTDNSLIFFVVRFYL